MKESAAPLVDVPVASDLPASPSAVVFDSADARLHIVLGGDLDDASDVDDLFDEVYEALGTDGSPALRVMFSGDGPGSVLRNLLRFVTEDCDRAVQAVSLTPDLAARLLQEVVGRPYEVLGDDTTAAQLPKVERAPSLFPIEGALEPASLPAPLSRTEDDEGATLMVAPVEAILDPTSLSPATATVAAVPQPAEADACLVDPDLPTDVRGAGPLASLPADHADHTEEPAQATAPDIELPQDDACSSVPDDLTAEVEAEGSDPSPALATAAHLEGRVPDAPAEGDDSELPSALLADDEASLPNLLDGEEDAILDDPFSADDDSRARPWGSTPDGDRRVLALRRTLRSGAIVRFPGDVVVFGDLNAGAQVVAAGDIVVLGKLRGLAHAGSRGDREAIVIGLDMQAGQVRIADAIAFPRPAAQSSGTSRLAAMLMRQPSPHRSITPAVARVVDGEIRIEDYRGRLHA